MNKGKKGRRHGSIESQTHFYRHKARKFAKWSSVFRCWKKTQLPLNGVRKKVQLQPKLWMWKDEKCPWWENGGQRSTRFELLTCDYFHIKYQTVICHFTNQCNCLMLLHCTSAATLSSPLLPNTRNVSSKDDMSAP